MSTPSIPELIELLDWNFDSNPSPYQWAAWRTLLSLPSEDVLPLLREKRAHLMQYAGYYPYNYEAAFIRCKATNKTNL